MAADYSGCGQPQVEIVSPGSVGFGRAFALIAAVGGAGPAALLDASSQRLSRPEQPDGGVAAGDVGSRGEALQRFPAQVDPLDGRRVVRSEGVDQAAHAGADGVDQL